MIALTSVNNAPRIEKVFFVAYLAFLSTFMFMYFSNLDGLRDLSGHDMVGRDFINFWQGGRVTWRDEISSLYQKGAYRELLIDEFGEPLGNYAFSYPPHTLIFLSFFGAFPYIAALAFWTIGGILAYSKVATGYIKSSFYLWVTILSPASIICLLSGQTGLFIAALFLFGLSQLEKRPWLSGAVFGILTIKPQIGVLLVVALLAGQYWRVILAASITSLLLLLVSIGLFGTLPWEQFLYETLPYQSEIISRSYGMFDHMVHSPFKWIINIGGSLQLAWAAQFIFMLAGVISVFYAFRMQISLPLKIAFLCAMTLLFSPYIAIYDMTILSVAAMIYYQFIGSRNASVPLNSRVLVYFLIVTPFLGYVASARFNFPLTVILVLIFAFTLFKAMRKEARSESVV